MKFILHFTVGEHDDSILVQGATLEEVRKACQAEEAKRGLDPERNCLWTEEVR